MEKKKTKNSKAPGGTARPPARRRQRFTYKHYEKLVRDKIPRELRAKGLKVKAEKLEKGGRINHLVLKLREEADELKDAVWDPNPKRKKILEEAADLSQVLHDLTAALGIPWRQVRLARRAKLKRRGGFAKGIYLVSVGTPEGSAQDEKKPK